MNLQIKAVSPRIGREIPKPFYATDGAAGLDLCACIDAAVTIHPRALVQIPTGIAIALPDPGFAAFLFARSGLAVRHGITLPNCVGLIDSDYRGEITVGLTNLSNTPYTIEPGERIAQLVLMPVTRANLNWVESLDDTARGAGGFGSTGR